MVEFSKDEIREVALDVRDEMGPSLVGDCWEVCHGIGNRLIDKGLPHRDNPYEVFEVRIGPNGEENHFVLEIPGEYIADTTANWLIVDASLDQFCEENKENGEVTVALGPRSELQPVNIYGRGVDEIGTYMTVDEYLDIL